MLIWKELRENARFVGVACALLVGLTFGVASWRPHDALTSHNFRAMTEFVFPILAFVLGLLQVVRENAGARWSYLTHRPVTLAQIFRAKATAGLALYTLAAGTPFIGAIAWAAIPGHSVPAFHPLLALPGLVDLLVGSAYWFVGVTVGIRQARWLGTRALPIAGGVLATEVAHAYAFGTALALVVAVTAGMAFVAWTSFLRRVRPSETPRGGRVAVGLAIAAGVLFLEFHAVKWVVVVRMETTVVGFDREGEPHRWASSGSAGQLTMEGGIKASRTIRIGEYERFRSYRDSPFIHLDGPSVTSGSAFDVYADLLRGYVSVHDPASDELRGFVDGARFVPVGEAVAARLPLGVDLLRSLVLVSPETAIGIVDPTRPVTLFSPPPNDRIVAAVSLDFRGPHAFFTRDGVTVTDSRGRVLLVAPFAATDDDDIGVEHIKGPNEWLFWQGGQVTRVSDDGRILNTRPIPPGSSVVGAWAWAPWVMVWAFLHVGVFVAWMRRRRAATPAAGETSRRPASPRRRSWDRFGPMGALVTKELRQNGGWAFLAMLGLVLGVLEVMTRDFDFWNDIPPLALMGASAVGTVLGLVQTLPDSSRNKWPVLVHRPASRTVIFIGKVAAGSLLYSAAVGIPLSIPLVWAAMPGVLPGPFEWSWTLPFVAYGVAGFAWYFAAMTVGMRRARWTGTRLLPFGVALLALIGMLSADSFVVALLVTGGATIVLAAAAGAAFIARDREATLGTVGRTALAVVLGVSAYGGLSLAVNVATDVLSSEIAHRRRPRSTVAFDPTGELVLLGRNGATDVQGRPLPEAEESVRWNTMDLIWPYKNNIFQRPVLPEVARGTLPDGRPFVALVDRETGMVSEYAEADSLLGVWGPEGLVPPDRAVPAALPPHPTRMSGGWIGMPQPIVYPKEAYVPDDHRMKHVFSVESDDEILRVLGGPFSLSDAADDEQLGFAFVTRKGLRLTDVHGDRSVTLPHPPHFDLRAPFEIWSFEQNEDIAVLQWPYVTFYNRSGALVRQDDYIAWADTAEMSNASYWDPLFIFEERPDSPLLYALRLASAPDVVFRALDRDAVSQLLPPWIPLVLASAASIALLAHRRAIARRESLVWVGAGLVFGPPVVVAFLGLTDAPLTEPSLW